MSKSSGQRPGITETAKELVTGVVGRLAARTAGGTSSPAFIRNTWIGDRYEVEAARIALTRAQSPRVQEIAQQMLDDHTTSTHQLQSALRMNETRGQDAPPEEVDERRRTMLESLREVPDDEFDRAYLEQQVLAHKEMVALMSSYRNRGKDAQLRSLAAGMTPVVERHLRHMRALRGELAG